MRRSPCQNVDAESVSPFGSHAYSKEELVAEMGAAFLCAQAGIDYLRLLERNNKRPEAVSFIYALIADQPEKPDLRGRLAEFHLREGKVGMAISELDQLAIYYEDNGDIRNAVRTVEQILRLEPLNREEYETALLRLRSQL